MVHVDPSVVALCRVHELEECGARSVGSGGALQVANDAGELTRLRAQVCPYHQALLTSACVPNLNIQTIPLGSWIA